jgi:hypothetical protein
MKQPLQTIVVCLALFAFFSAPGVVEAGPFENFFTALRKSFAHPAPKARSPQSHRSNPKQSNESPPSDASDSSDASTTLSSQPTASPTATPAPAPPNRNNVRVAKATPTKKHSKNDMPYGIPVPGKQGLVTSPFSPDSGYIDVRSFPPGTEVRDPYTGKSFLTP